MVSIRRRRLLGLCSSIYAEQKSMLGLSVNGNTLKSCEDYVKSVETSLEAAQGLPEMIGSSPLKETQLQQFSEVKRRKQHRRRHGGESHEQCTMRGVYFKNRKWQAAIKVDKKQIHLGTVGSEEEAAKLYDRAAFMCGREPNFVLSEDEKRELLNYKWDEFLALTRSAIANKRQRRRCNQMEEEKGHSFIVGRFSGSEDETLAT